MQITITKIDHATRELEEQLPLVIELLKKLPGDDRPDYWLGRAAKPIRWRDNDTDVVVTHVVLVTQRQEAAIVPGVENLLVAIAYVADESQVSEERFDSNKSKYVATGLAQETSVGGLPKQLDSDLHGVGGWLALLIVGLCILGPLLGAGKLEDQFQAAEKATPTLASMESWQTYQQHMWWIFGLSALLGVSAGYELWKVHAPKSVRFAIVALWLSNLAAVVGYSIVGYIAFGQTAFDDFAPILLKNVVSAVIVAGVWTLYLMKSRRVRNTYNWRSK